VQQDTFPETIQVDTLSQDSSLSISLGVPVSQDALEDAVDYNADTMKLNARNQKI